MDLCKVFSCFTGGCKFSTFIFYAPLNRPAALCRAMCFADTVISSSIRILQRSCKYINFTMSCVPAKAHQHLLFWKNCFLTAHAPHKFSADIPQDWMALVSFLRKGCFAPVKLSWIPESLASSETGICERAPGASLHPSSHTVMPVRWFQNQMSEHCGSLEFLKPELKSCGTCTKCSWRNLNSRPLGLPLNSKQDLETCSDDLMKSHGLEAICLSCNSELEKHVLT